EPERGRRTNGSPLTVAGAAADLPPDDGPAEAHDVPFSPARAGPATFICIVIIADWASRRICFGSGTSPWREYRDARPITGSSPRRSGPPCSGSERRLRWR